MTTRLSPAHSMVPITTWGTKTVKDPPTVHHYLVDVGGFRDPIGQGNLKNLRGENHGPG